MRPSVPNDYERAFGNWLIDNRVPYIAVDEKKRTGFGKLDIKSFDYLLYPKGPQSIIAEVKGRKFKGTSFTKLRGFECWVTTDDIEGLRQWEKVMGTNHIAAFIFAYKIEKVDVDFDGRDIYDYKGDNYIFFAVKLDDYCSYMKLRSPKWKTVTLPADKFRACAVQVQNTLF